LELVELTVEQLSVWLGETSLNCPPVLIAAMADSEYDGSMLADPDFGLAELEELDEDGGVTAAQQRRVVQAIVVAREEGCVLRMYGKV
jgi:hypothetical protein